MLIRLYLTRTGTASQRTASLMVSHPLIQDIVALLRDEHPFPSIVHLRPSVLERQTLPSSTYLIPAAKRPCIQPPNFGRQRVLTCLSCRNLCDPIDWLDEGF